METLPILCLDISVAPGSPHGETKEIPELYPRLELNFAIFYCVWPDAFKLE